MKRSPLCRFTPLLRVPFKPARVDGSTSRQRRAERRASDKRTTDFTPEAKAAIKRRSGGRCESCGQPGTDNSHRQRRNTTNGDASNGVRLCRGCHVWCHSNPADAEALGLFVRSGFAYASMPVLLVYGWVRLDDRGGWTPVEVAS